MSQHSVVGLAHGMQWELKIVRQILVLAINRQPLLHPKLLIVVVEPKLYEKSKIFLPLPLVMIDACCSVGSPFTWFGT